MTAVEIGQNYFVADVMYESVKRTNLKRLKTGDEVNLEKSLTLNSYLKENYFRIMKNVALGYIAYYAASRCKLHFEIDFR